jgi:hypothetical protein
MKICPWCGRNNLDSDEYCFNCERYLDAKPDAEEIRDLEREKRLIRVQKPPSIARLGLSSILRKALYLILALGIFFIFALLSIWVSYDNTPMFLAAVAVMGGAVICALYIPDVLLSRRIGTKGALVSVLSNGILLALLLPPALMFLERRRYISGAWDVLSKTWWAIVAFLVVGALISWIAGRRTVAETARP